MFRVIHFDTVDSTNSYALREMANLADGDVLCADAQTAGRGRLGRVWSSPDLSNLYMSIVLKPSGNVSDLPLSNVTQYLCVVVCRAAAELGINCSIKWPNDVFYDGKKCAGILCEASFSGGKFNGMVAGVGVNLNHYPSSGEINADAVSLFSACGRKIGRNQFLYRIMDIFFSGYESFMRSGFSFIRDEYLDRFLFMNREISVVSSGSTLTGIAVDITHDGRLVIEDFSGVRHSVISGELVPSFDNNYAGGSSRV